MFDSFFIVLRLFKLLFNFVGCFFKWIINLLRVISIIYIIFSLCLGYISILYIVGVYLLIKIRNLDDK